MTAPMLPILPSLLPPLLSSLPAATASSEPPTALLPLLSPILRQRVQYLNSASNEPWLDMLCYDDAKAQDLSQVIRRNGDRFEPHPVSGEVEVDWDHDTSSRYRRVDEETLQTLVALPDFDLTVKLIWCVGDAEGGGDGWRIGEVSVLSTEEFDAWGSRTIGEAETKYTGGHNRSVAALTERRETNATTDSNHSWQVVQGEAEDEDDDYWAQYDNTPARTPGPGHSPAPRAGEGLRMTSNLQGTMSAEDAYFAQYESVQPALDNHDPDEAAMNGEVETTLGNADIATQLRQNLHSHPEINDISRTWGDAPAAAVFPPPTKPDTSSSGRDRELEGLIQPRPTSAASNSSGGSATVAKLEKSAAAQGQSDVGVKQHLATSVKSLYRLAKASGIDRGEFQRLVRTELDLLSVGEDED